MYLIEYEFRNKRDLGYIKVKREIFDQVTFVLKIEFSKSKSIMN